eukprot:363169-Chlamydomonas_euryale.AAC.10
MFSTLTPRPCSSTRSTSTLAVSRKQARRAVKRMFVSVSRHAGGQAECGLPRRTRLRPAAVRLTVQRGAPVANAHGSVRSVEDDLCELPSSALTALQEAAKRPKAVSPAHVSANEGGQRAGRYAMQRHAKAPRGRLADPPPMEVPFVEMHAQLEQWNAKYHTSHVPYLCFDAPLLGAWVRALRREARTGTLPAWQREALNVLRFEWTPSKADMLWHAKVHQLRQLRAVLGVPSDNGNANGIRTSGIDTPAAWRHVSGWLRHQGELFAAGQLPEDKQRTLAAVGAVLHVPVQEAARQAQLRGLSTRERRWARKRWRAADTSFKVRRIARWQAAARAALLNARARARQLHVRTQAQSQLSASNKDSMHVVLGNQHASSSMQPLVGHEICLPDGIEDVRGSHSRVGNSYEF